MKKNHKRYYRVIEIDYRIFDEWLNLPKGFEVTAFQEDTIKHLVRLGISCPHKKQYAVEDWKEIPTVTPVVYTNKYGIVTKLWHPDLGQQEPKELGEGT